MNISCQDPHVLKSCNIGNKSKPSLNVMTSAAGIWVSFVTQWSLPKEIQVKKGVRSFLWEMGEGTGTLKVTNKFEPYRLLFFYSIN